MYANIVKVMSTQNTLFFICSYFVGPVGDRVFAVLGTDRVLYTPIDSSVGKEYAVRVVRKSAWNVSMVKVRKYGGLARYTIPRQFAKQLGVSRGDRLLVLGIDDGLYAIPLRYVVEKIGGFREPML